MLYSIAIHFFVGVLTGCIFRVRVLLGLMIAVLLECGVIALTAGGAAALWSLTGLVAIQIGYLGGIYVRSLLEKAGLTQPDARVGRVRQ